MATLMRQKAERIVRRLTEAGHQALFAGGCVRDMVRGETPHDYDIATDATPEEVMALFERTVPVGSKFGVVIVVVGEDQFEVASFRTDLGYSDGRHPDGVAYADAREDALRRDFTINGLFYDPVTDEVVDYVEGQADLDARLIRAIGEPDRRIAEDALRLLRAIRFAARFGFRIEEHTEAAIRAHAGEIQQVSAERIRDELARILTGPRPGYALDLAQRMGLLRQVLPEVDDMVGCEQPPEFHPEGDVFTHTCLALDQLHEPSVELAFGVLLHDVGKPPTREEGPDRARFHHHDKLGAEMAERICERLRFSTAQSETIVDLAAQHMRFLNVREMRESKLKRFLRGPHIQDLLELHRADCVASHGDLTSYHFCRSKLGSLKEEEIRPPRLLTGDDLMDIGYVPGPIFSKILERVEDAQLEGEIQTREDALGIVRREFPRLKDTRAT